MKKFTALFLIAALLCAVLCGCGTSSSIHSYSGTEGQSEQAETSDPSAAETETEAETETMTSYLIDWDGAYAAYDPDTVVATVNGQSIAWEEYFYWIYQAYYTLSYYIGDVPDWDEIFPYDESMTYQDYVMDYVHDMLLQYHVLDSKAAELGVALTDEDEAEFEEIWQENVDYYGDEETLLEAMAEQHLTKDLYHYMVGVSLLYDRLYESMYGVDGAELDEDEAVAFMEGNDYMRVKHILMMSVDDEGNALSDEELTNRYEQMTDFLNQLREVEPPEAREALFDELMTENSEDTGLASYPDGYVFTYGDMVDEFYQASVALEDYGLSDIVESSYGYHIILRLPMRADDIPINDTMTIRSLAAEYMLDSNMDSWVEEADLVYTEEFETLSLSELLPIQVTETEYTAG